MKRKRIVSVMLVAAMAATLFAGCGKNGGNDNGSTQGGSASNDGKIDRKSTRLNSSHRIQSRMPSSA